MVGQTGGGGVKQLWGRVKLVLGQTAYQKFKPGLVSKLFDPAAVWPHSCLTDPLFDLPLWLNLPIEFWPQPLPLPLPLNKNSGYLESSDLFRKFSTIVKHLHTFRKYIFFKCGWDTRCWYRSEATSLVKLDYRSSIPELFYWKTWLMQHYY